MLSSASRSMHLDFFLIAMTERPTSMLPWNFPFSIWMTTHNKRNMLEGKRDNVSNNISSLLWLLLLHKSYCWQILILTSAMHLPYLSMPLSREKYLCRQKSAQSVSVPINPSVCNIADSKSEVMAVSMRSWQTHLMHDVKGPAWSHVCLSYSECLSSSSSCPASGWKWFSSYCTSPKSDRWKQKGLKSSDCKSILNVCSSINQQAIS